MKLVSFEVGLGLRFGVLDDRGIADLTDVRDAPPSMTELLGRGLAGMAWASHASTSAPKRIPLDSVHLLAPVPRPRKFLALGGNYASHVAEVEHLGLMRGTAQIWFNKQVSCVNGPYDPIVKPSVSEQFDYEGELGVVIGLEARKVSADRAWIHVAGFVVINDLSVRDWQMRSPTHTLGKSFDTHGPFGPWLTTADAVPNPYSLKLTTHVNGELRQSASTGELMHKIPAMIEELSTAFTLEPGDVLSTGSPAGVGGLRKPPCYLRSGDVVRVEIETLGALENHVMDEIAMARADADAVEAYHA